MAYTSVAAGLMAYTKFHYNYHQASNISHTSVHNNIVDHWDVDGALPVGAAPTTSSFSC